MDAVKLLEEKNRMTKCCSISCYDCPLSNGNNGTNLHCAGLEHKNPEKYVSIVEEWSKNNPKKTRQSEFLKMFPNTALDDRGIVKLSPCNLGYTCKNPRRCRECLKEFWLGEIEEEEENAEIH